MKAYPQLYSLTPLGMQVFEKIFNGDLPDSALVESDRSLVVPVSGTKALEIRTFASAKDMAKAILDALGSQPLHELLAEKGLWAWLTFVLRDQIFSKDKEGRRKVGEVHRWLPGNPNDWQKGQRHMVRMPVLLLANLGEDADHLLCNGPAVLPEIREQLTSQQDMFTRSFQKLARTLYYDDRRRNLKTGAGGKGGGSPRRLAKVRQQLDVTWDLDEPGFERVLATLPAEFERFKSKDRSGQ